MNPSGESKLYTKRFFSNQQEGSRRSAQKIVPIVMQMVAPKSVLDVGCGVGTWLTVFSDEGSTDLVGVDGDYVDRNALLIPQDRFLSRDLKEPLNIGRTFDLVCSLEVAEHLPPPRAHIFVESLTRHAPVVLFSAAVPQQGGTGHLNERWPSYWAEIFNRFDFEAIDCVRRHVWEDSDVEPWYAQNAILYVRRDYLQHTPTLLKEREAAMGVMPLDVVHPGVLANSLFHQDFKLRLDLSQPTREQRVLATNVPKWLDEIMHNPSDAKTLDALRKARGVLAMTFIESPPEQLPAIFGGAMGATYRAFMRSMFRYESFTDAERGFVDAKMPLEPLNWSDPRTAGKFLATSLYRFPHQYPQAFELKSVSEWLREDWITFACEPVLLFKERGEIDAFGRYARWMMDQFQVFLASTPDVEHVRRIVELIGSAAYSKCLSLSRSDDATAARASRPKVLDTALRFLGHIIELQPGPVAHHDSPRIGVLTSSFSARPESLAVLHLMENLDRDRCELRAYQMQTAGDAIEQRIASEADTFVTLPPELHERVRVIRGDALDLLLIESNLDLLAVHQLARSQAVVSMSPANVPESSTTISATRADIGIAADITLLVAPVDPAAITPEVQLEWIDALRADAKTFLLLAPPPPGWMSDFPNNAQLNDFRARMRQANVDPTRLGVTPSGLQLDQWLALLKLADKRLEPHCSAEVTAITAPEIARQVESLLR